MQFSAAFLLPGLSCTLEIYDQTEGAARCGDGLVELGEVCDDGNTASGDGCSADCRSTEICGNGFLDTATGEQCDHIRLSATCNANCTFSRCGDGISNVLAGEVCDDGNTVSGDGCSANCRSNEICGNGIVDVAAGEVCDDGNTVSGDGCSADCWSTEICGNLFLDVGEQCDNGGRPSATCNANCTIPMCGDGILNVLAGEVCDDGNTINGDGCESNCTPTP